MKFIVQMIVILPQAKINPFLNLNGSRPEV